MNRVFLVALLCTACSAPEFAYETAQGIAVFCDEPRRCFSQASVESTTEILIGMLPKSDSFRRVLADSAIALTVHPEPFFACSQSNNGSCTGIYYTTTNEMQVSYANCVGNSSLAHELLHVYLHQIHGNADDQHQDRFFFKESCQGRRCSLHALETKAGIQASFAACLPNTAQDSAP